MYREKILITHRDIFPDLKKQPKCGKWTNVGESSTTNFCSNMFSYVVKLAPESPHNNKSYGIVNHDESSYDSFHNYETGK